VKEKTTLFYFHPGQGTDQSKTLSKWNHSTKNLKITEIKKLGIRISTGFFCPNQ